MDTFYRNYGVNPGRSGFDLCLEAGSLVDETRKAARPFFGGTDSNRLVFGYNSTDALNLAIFGMIKPGDHVVTTHVEHNATLRPLWKLEQERRPGGLGGLRRPGLGGPPGRSSGCSGPTPRRWS